MNLIVNSKTLAEALAAIDFDKQPIDHISVVGNNLLFFSEPVDPVASVLIDAPHDATYRQEQARWDWARDTLARVGSQPVVVMLDANSVKLLFEY